MSFTCASTSTAAATVRCIAGMAFPTNQVWPLQPLLHRTNAVLQRIRDRVGLLFCYRPIEP